MTTDSNLKPMGTQSQETVNMAAAKAEGVADKAFDAINEGAEAVSSVMDQALVSLQEATKQLREQAKKATDVAMSYTRDEPVNALLIAAVTGALLMGVVAMMVRARV